MNITPSVLQYLDDHNQEAFDLLIELAQIPAPSHHEEKRAEFCKQWLKKQGAKGVYIDDALNVVYPVNCEGNNPIVVFMAHSDVVFPDTTPLPLRIEDGKIYCPGIGDDTASVVAMLMSAKYIAQNGLVPKDVGVMIVVNSCEEGLGNCKGCRKIMDQFGSRIREFITFDGAPSRYVNAAVGSRRYRVEVTTEGGHSYGAFGNRNAIAYLASIIKDLYAIQVPALGKTTYNVGTISGGTSVNTIAQQAEMLYEFRSDRKEDLEIMEKHFRSILKKYRDAGLDVQVTLMGERPCGTSVDVQRQQALERRCAAAGETYYGIPVTFHSGSTDCNIPLSMGIPSVCVGCRGGGGVHTREEYVDIDTLAPGIKVAADLILYHF